MTHFHEWMFYELMWRVKVQGRPMPLPWWIQQYFRHWVDAYDSGLFPSKEAAFASNAHYRYWNMVGVKDHHQESLVGQAGEIEPVYDQYAVSFFLFDPAIRILHLPQFPHSGGAGPGLEQGLEDGYLPVVVTEYRSPIGIDIREKVIATTVGVDQRSMVLARYTARLTDAASSTAWFCVAVSPSGPSGFQRHDKTGRYIGDRRMTYIRYLAPEQRLEVNAAWGPVFGEAPTFYGLYGNRDARDPQYYIDANPYHDLVTQGKLNGQSSAADYVAGLCVAVFAWPLRLTTAQPEYALDIRLPIDDYRGGGDLTVFRTADADTLEGNNRTFWTHKLDRSGLQASMPGEVLHLFDLFRICRAQLLILSDHGEIHPGPTIYDSFWVRDSSIEGVACALVGDQNLAERQFGHHYPSIFHIGNERLGPVSLRGFFGGEHEINDFEWDSNGQALWAIGRFDRIRGAATGFGAGLYSPYILEGARWLRDNRSPYGLLHSGWSAEHIGEKEKPHYWDDFWALAGLWEAAMVAERIGASEAAEIWETYDQILRATADSIRWVLAEQASQGYWETYIPTGPADVGRLDSTMIGTVAYFHPCRLYMGAKLGEEIDRAARMTLETLWARFVEGGFRHEAAWNAFGPYLTLQLAHAFLFLGDVDRMDLCLAWAVEKGAYARVSGSDGADPHRWQVVTGAWNEQHCYPVAKDFTEVPSRGWYMGDIPHGWACAEFLLLLRDILFFEADEDGDPHVYIAPGVMTHWLKNGESIGIADAPTIFGSVFGYRLTHRQATKTIEITIQQPLPLSVRMIYPCRFGSGVRFINADGRALPVIGPNVMLPAGTTQATIGYL